MSKMAEKAFEEYNKDDFIRYLEDKLDLLMEEKERSKNG
jgi:hypothetical protein